MTTLTATGRSARTGAPAATGLIDTKVEPDDPLDDTVLGAEFEVLAEPDGSRTPRTAGERVSLAAEAVTDPDDVPDDAL